MSDKVTISVTFDNNRYKEALETAWGFSCVVRGAEITILFDTGANGSMLLDNMKKLKIEPGTIDLVVLSHIHGDHTGGIEKFLEKNPKVTVYMPESFPQNFKEKVTNYGANIVEVGKTIEICKDVYSSGQFGILKKEQSLIIRTDKGLVIITGCAHPGILKILKAAKDLLKDDIVLAMGGFHLEYSGKSKIEKIISAFKQLNVRYAGPCHCTGDKARHLFQKQFGRHYINVGAGKVITTADL